MNVTWCLIAALAGTAVFFSSRERKAGQSGRSVGFFILAVLFIVLAFFAALVFVL